ncbi:TPA: nucleotidyltransferase, partial [candidate division WOR-3 bacterium]|nr:nucleotidyltransferase [candidate division WOR-3 bacterium]
MNELMKFMINEESTIFDALSKINKTGRQILFTVNKKNHVTGSLTDGDIRRAILKSIHLESKVKL